MPQDRKAASRPGAGRAATAHWVSCPAAAMTFAPLYSPTTVPLATSGAKRVSGMAKALSTCRLQPTVRASSSWLVEAMVVSQASAPHRAWANRSGMNSIRFALPQVSGSCSRTASS